jgi:hypothetical protein
MFTVTMYLVVTAHLVKYAQILKGKINVQITLTKLHFENCVEVQIM